MVQLVVLSANGEQRCAKVAHTGEITGLISAKVLRKTKPLDLIGTWAFKEQTLQLWGASTGKAGTENKHELPPPHDTVLLFGDVVVSLTTGDLTLEAWASFYEEAFSGFEDLVSDEDDEEEDAEEDAEEEEEEIEADVEADEADGDAEEEEEEEDVDEDCYDDDEGGGKRRPTRRRTTTEPEYRRIDMGLRARIKLPAPLGKRAPKWQTGEELEPEAY